MATKVQSRSTWLRRLLALALLAGCAARVPSVDGGAAAPEPPAPPAIEQPSTPAAVLPRPTNGEVLERALVIGASLSAGFGLYQEVGEVVTLAGIVDQALLVPHAPVVGLGNALLFQSPLERGAAQVERAQELDPTLVVALDFLFWFGYGMPLTESQRLGLLEHGLELLGRFSCPVLVGDFPDMRGALASEFEILGQRMIYPQQIPEPATLAALNARVRAWSGTRSNVVIVPLGDFALRTSAGTAFEFRGQTLAGGEEAFLQRDLLHPNLAGACATALLALDALARSPIGAALAPDAVRWNVDELRGLVWEAAAPARAEREAKAKARAERTRAATAAEAAGG